MENSNSYGNMEQPIMWINKPPSSSPNSDIAQTVTDPRRVIKPIQCSLPYYFSTSLLCPSTRIIPNLLIKDSRDDHNTYQQAKRKGWNKSTLQDRTQSNQAGQNACHQWSPAN